MPVQPALRGAILWLFFFNGVLDRLATHFFGIAVFTKLFYACVGLALALRVGLFIMKGLRGPVAEVSSLLFVVFVFLLGSLYGDPIASVYGIKLFFFGAVLLIIFSESPPKPRTLVVAVLSVQAYALFQGVHFFAMGYQLPPWDAAHIAGLLESGEAMNVGTGELLRPFATFSSFFEYQVSTHAIVVALFLTRNGLDDGTRRLAVVALLSTLAVDAIVPERTPIMLAAIACVVAGFGSHVVLSAYRGDYRLLLGAGLVLAVALCFVIVPALWIDSSDEMLRRLAESFRFWEAETVHDRAEGPWNLAMATIGMFPEGVGPAEVALDYNPLAQTPHNNIFLFAIGYSVLFPPLFFVYVAIAFWPLFRSMVSLNEARSRLGFTAAGLLLGYLVAGMFNAPFSSYPGGAFFMTLAMMRSRVTQLGGEPSGRS